MHFREQRKLARGPVTEALHQAILPVSFSQRLSAPNLTEARTKTTTDRTISSTITSIPSSDQVSQWEHGDSQPVSW